MVRQEKKGKHIEYSPENLNRVLAEYAGKFGLIEPLGHLSRARLSMWPNKTDNDRVFHLSIDRCTKENSKTLYQLEIEYVGRERPKHPTGNQTSDVSTEKDIIGDLCDLSWRILQFANKNYPHLVPNHLTKLEWLVK